jgi:hypothetical protein
MQPVMSTSCQSATAINDCLATVGRNSSQTRELTLASAEVVLRRMTLGGFAMINPAGADHDEFNRMVPEKTEAFAAAASILIRQSVQIGQELARMLVDHAFVASESASAALGSAHPGGMLAAQADVATSWAARMAARCGAMCLLALETQGAVLAPIHRAATDNVERLRA